LVFNFAVGASSVHNILFQVEDWGRCHGRHFCGLPFDFFEIGLTLDVVYCIKGTENSVRVAAEQMRIRRGALLSAKSQIQKCDVIALAIPTGVHFASKTLQCPANGTEDCRSSKIHLDAVKRSGAENIQNKGSRIIGSARTRQRILSDNANPTCTL
jgi:hypothetical protein